ncbi:MAG: hypothetical protein GY851_10390 [bacterium]|nr:hypothetical protein [bacterium]
MTPLPTIPFGGHRISRLIVGGNPFRGNSHFSDTMSRDMEAHFTVNRVKQTLSACERHGINTVQARGDALIQACIREFRAEGGRMHFIAQTASELRNLHGHVRQLAAFGCAGVYVHGTWTDRHYLAGDLAKIEDLLKCIRDTGVQVGLGTHIPEVIELAEDRAWDLDFYMACLYNLSIRQRDRESAVVAGAHKAEEVFDHDDRFKMLDRIAQTDKTCLAFKVLGASRLCSSPAQVREAFETVLTRIKPNDAIVVGMYPKDRDQVAENGAIVREILDGIAAD